MHLFLGGQRHMGNNNAPWEPCPRCGSKRVKVVDRSSKSAGPAGMVSLIAVLLILSFMVNNWLNPNGIGGAIVTILVFVVVSVMAAPILVLLAALGGLVLTSGVKGFVATCQDCEFQWEPREAAKAASRPSHANQDR